MKHKATFSEFRTLPLLMRIGVIIGIIGLVDAILFECWRWDKPSNNPGGPIGPMGFWPVFWELSVSLLFGVSTICTTVGTMIQLAAKKNEMP